MHPFWWMCMLLLVVNDHVLKGAGVLPEWLTGKLSDFAGLVVAPVCLVSLLRLQKRWAKAVVFGSVAFVFSALQFSDTLVRAVQDCAAVVGLSWRIWPDPTDLIALPILLVAWRISSSDHAWFGKTQARLRTGVGIVGAVACLATSEAEPYPTAAYLLNTTHFAFRVDLYQAPQPFDCTAFEADPLTTVPLDAYELWFSESALSPLIPWPLDRDAKARPECDAVLMRSDDLPDSIFYWREGSLSEVYSYWYDMTDGLDPNAVYIERVGDEYVLSSEAVRIVAVE